MEEGYSIDTISGIFMYEANVPLVAHARDQIEQTSLIIKFDSLCYQNPIALYDCGVFFYLCSRSKRDSIEMNVDIKYSDDNSVISMLKKLNYMINATDSNYLRTIIFDNEKILMYKKIYAKFTYVNIGKTNVLVPKLQNYRCCYSHSKRKIDSYCILKVLEYEVY
ncbi:hypothetical protein SAMN05216311_108220 [Chitinophaga sp. CF418]|nr:hypothetical protein SAMN05216311_108220 [Chitinophaga sp. CF418]